MTDNRRTLAGLILSTYTIKSLGTDQLVPIPVNVALYNSNIEVSVPYSKFIFDRPVYNIVIKYSFIFRTSRRGSRVEVPLDIGLKLNGLLTISERGQEPFWVNETHSGLMGSIVLIGDFKAGDHIQPVVINRGIGCDVEFQSVTLNLYDGGANVDLAKKCAYTHYQTVPSNRWVMPHPLDFIPNVRTVGADGIEFRGVLEYSNTNTVIVNFKPKVTGRAFFS